jgi:hypothetical protein
MLKQYGYILCWCAKWLNDTKVYSDALINYPDYKNNPENDKYILQTIWKLLDEADIVIGHNVADFDVKQLNTAFIKNGMKPPSPYKIVDTLLVARRKFSFLSNKLADLGKILKLGEKVETGGFSLWKRCLAGDKKAWQHMLKYNKQDVMLLEKVYYKMLPYIENHPHYGSYIDDNKIVCTNCGSTKLNKNGFTFNNLAKYQRLLCQDCGSWMRMRINLNDKTKIKLSSR